MKRVFAVFFALLLFFTAGCAQQSRLDRIEESGKIVVFTNANFPPFEFARGTKVVGSDVDLAVAIADKIGVKLEMKDADFDGIISAVAGGKADIAISAFTIDDSKLDSVDFSIPYARSAQFLVLPADSDIENMEDLAGKRVAAAIGYSGQVVLDQEIRDGVLAGSNVAAVYVNSAAEGSLELLSGKQDALIMDEYVAKKIAAQNQSLKTVKLIYADGRDIAEEYGVVVPKNNYDLLAVVNATIEELLQSGQIDAWIMSYVD
jgi:polar amino acid transport system substrate-binding protein